MRCPYCQRYMHKLHKSVIEHDDGSADVCDCPRCNADERAVIYNANPEYAGRGPTFDNQNYGVVTIATVVEGAPPPHPLPFDHGKFRVAEEALGADLTQPWESFYCLECKELTWRHDKRADLCETCSYMLVTEMADLRVQKENRTRFRLINPFG